MARKAIKYSNINNKLKVFILTGLIMVLITPYISSLLQGDKDLYSFYFTNLVEEKEETELETEGKTVLLQFYLSSHNYPTSGIISLQVNFPRIREEMPSTIFHSHELPPPKFV